MVEKESPLTKTAERMLGNLSINAISEKGIGEVSCICPYIPGSVLNNWTVKEIPDMCLEEPQDFEDDQDCNLSPDLLRMKQILPHKESVEIVSLGDKQEKKEVKIRACITAETKRDLIELF
ncbi:trans-resveratrol di-O-methyltransferase-like [Gossypium australe]|uniref:Trans-resveratrol di-O-methyltransferase-like n=1 Tax=Gossypium australe TaxID=47621 RepID=A0A5B6VE96_9ROSI|nr:trans-resveratrol di-O-methyltransferase-like [Gossypium australe]